MAKLHVVALPTYLYPLAKLDCMLVLHRIVGNTDQERTHRHRHCSGLPASRVGSKILEQCPCPRLDNDKVSVAHNTAIELPSMGSFAGRYAHVSTPMPNTIPTWMILLSCRAPTHTCDHSLTTDSPQTFLLRSLCCVLHCIHCVSVCAHLFTRHWSSNTSCDLLKQPT